MQDRKSEYETQHDAGADARPALAVGHVSLRVQDVPAACAFFARHGMREIVQQSDFAVLELRGGTHLVLRGVTEDVGGERDAPFDLMVDDIDAAHARFRGEGTETSDIERGRIHDSFRIGAPDGYRITVTSSHAGDRPV